jgi:WD40 repeat protein
MADPATERPIPVSILSGHADAVWQARFSPDGTRIASASLDQTVKLWDGFTGKLQGNLTGHRGWVRVCRFSPDGNRLVSGSRDRTVKLWDPESGAEVNTLKGHRDEVNRLVFCAGGTRIASGSLDGTVRLWDAETGASLATLDGPLGRVAALGAARSGSLIAASQEEWVTNNCRVTIWDSATGTRLATLKPAELVLDLALSPDGELIVTGGRRGALTIWNSRTGLSVANLPGHTGSVAGCDWSADGGRIASASHDHTVRIWDPALQQMTSLLKGHSAEVFGCRFSEDSRFLITASDDRTVRWFNARSGAGIAILTGHTDDIHSIEFSPDGTRVLSASHDKTLRLWDLQPVQRERDGHPSSRPDRRVHGARLFAFLSYRRESGSETARLIRAELLSRGHRTFLDVDDLGAHHFDESLLKRIEEAQHFILVLSPGALDRCMNQGDWLRREISHAISTSRNIVPVLKEGFQFPSREKLPDELHELPRYNCVEYSHIYFGATMERLLTFCGAS